MVHCIVDEFVFHYNHQTIDSFRIWWLLTSYMFFHRLIVHATFKLIAALRETGNHNSGCSYAVYLFRLLHLVEYELNWSISQWSVLSTVLYFHWYMIRWITMPFLCFQVGFSSYLPPCYLQLLWVYSARYVINKPVSIFIILWFGVNIYFYDKGLIVDWSASYGLTTSTYTTCVKICRVITNPIRTIFTK